jgi:benzoate 4-monooxygenase
LIPPEPPPVEILGQVFFPGTVLSLPAYTIHPCEEIWGPDADDFVPTRWDTSRLTKQQKAAFIPFSAGPRACVGRNVPEMELHCIADTVLSFTNFEFRLVPSTGDA